MYWKSFVAVLLVAPTFGLGMSSAVADNVREATSEVMHEVPGDSSQRSETPPGMKITFQDEDCWAGIKNHGDAHHGTGGCSGLPNNMNWRVWAKCPTNNPLKGNTVYGAWQSGDITSWTPECHSWHYVSDAGIQYSGR